MLFISSDYYQRKCHVAKNWKNRKYDVPRGVLKWIPNDLRKD